MLRKPHVTGYFYPAKREELLEELNKLIPATKETTRAIGIVVPHAGYIYSGPVAGRVYAQLEIPKTIVMLGVNHTGRGTRVSLFLQGEWETPLGTVVVNTGLGKVLLDNCEFIKEDYAAHSEEHSLEVQLPFLQKLKPHFEIVAMVFMPLDLEMARIIGKAIANAIKTSKESVLLLASSDMTHYEADKIAREKDSLAIDKILALDPRGLYRIVQQNNISMCGLNPVLVLLFAAKELGAKGGKLVHYMTSGEISGDFDAVVGYAGIVIT